MSIINGVRCIEDTEEEREAREHTAFVLRELADRIANGEGDMIDWEWQNELTSFASFKIFAPLAPTPREEWRMRHRAKRLDRRARRMVGIEPR